MYLLRSVYTVCSSHTVNTYTCDCPACVNVYSYGVVVVLPQGVLCRFMPTDLCG